MVYIIASNELKETIIDLDDGKLSWVEWRWTFHKSIDVLLEMMI